jgi:hypothetical protein
MEHSMKNAAIAAVQGNIKESNLRQALVFMNEDLVILKRGQVGVEHVASMEDVFSKPLSSSAYYLDLAITGLQNAIYEIEGQLEVDTSKQKC